MRTVRGLGVVFQLKIVSILRIYLRHGPDGVPSAFNNTLSVLRSEKNSRDDFVQLHPRDSTFKVSSVTSAALTIQKIVSMFHKYYPQTKNSCYSTMVPAKEQVMF